MSGRDFIRQLDNIDGFGKSVGWCARWHIDLILMGLLLLLSVLGVFVLYSATGAEIQPVIRQSVYLLVSFIGMLAVAQISPRILSRWAWLLYVVGIIMLLWVLIHGIQSKGAQRWIQLPGFRFQPSELIKLVMPIMMAAYLSKHPLPLLLSMLLLLLFLSACRSC